MKHKGFLAAMLLSSLLLILVACGGNGDSESDSESDSEGSSNGGETITLRAATGLSSQHAWWSDNMVPWMDRVEELTDGQVEFETFTGGELVEVPDEADAIKDGTIDVGLVLPIYEPDQYPMAEVTMLPLSTSDTIIASEAWRELLTSDEELQNGETYSEMMFGDFKVFPVSTTQDYSISTTGHEFNSVSDVEGTSLRTPSRIHEIYSDNIGINSVTMPAVEMYDAMSRGSFEGSYYSIADWSGYGFQDLFTYTVTGINFGHFNSFIGMNQESWGELPDNVKEAMDQANEEIFMPGAEEWENRAEELMAENKENGGQFVEFSELPTDVQDLFNEGIEDTWTEYADLLNEQDLPGDQLVRYWRDLIVEHGGEVPEGLNETLEE